MRNREVRGGGEKEKRGERGEEEKHKVERGGGENLLIVNVSGQIFSWSVPIVSEHATATPETLIFVSPREG